MIDGHEGFRSADEFTTEQALHMLDLYDRMLEDLGYEPSPYPDVTQKLSGKVFDGTKYEALSHARWMCVQGKKFIAAKRFEKAYRWIGMIQGLLFMGGVCTLAELQQHNSAA